tara:strand:+ start:467 stop:1006 length:540 start_codon:yes stop_codon:yes gene_type:complete
MASKKNDVSTLEFTGMELMSDPPQYVYERKDGSRVNSFTAPSEDQLQSRSKSLKIMKDKFFKNIGSGAGSPIDESLSPADRKKLRDKMRKMDKKIKKKVPGKMKGGAMKTKGMKKGGAMKTKGMKKGGAMKTKGMAKGGMMKSKGMAKGGAMKTKGGNRGGVKRNMRPPSSTKSGLYGR